MSGSIRVLYLLNNTIMDGSNISFVNLITELKKKGVAIYIAFPDSKLDQEFYKRTKKIVNAYYRVGLHNQVRAKSKRTIMKTSINQIKSVILGNNELMRRLRLRKEIIAIKDIVKKNQIDVIHTNVGVIHGGYFAAKELKIPHIWHIREYQTRDFGWDILPSKEKFEKYLKNCYVITITEDLIQYFNLHTYQKARCIYNGCFSKTDLACSYPKQKYFLCCSRLSQEKCIDEVIKAYSIFCSADVSNRDYRLKLAGFGNKEYILKLKRIAALCGVEDSVDFLGFQNDVKPLMDDATALIVASKFEGFGRMTAEAAFRGCLVIGKKTGGTKEILEKTGGYMYLDGENELSEKMKTVARLTKDEYMGIVSKAQSVAVDMFSNEQAAENVFSLYVEVKNEK